MKLKLGFEEIYVIIVNNKLEYECIYDSFTADNQVKKLKDTGFKAEKMTLEQAFYDNFLTKCKTNHK